MRPEVDAIVAKTLGPQFKAEILNQVQQALSAISLERVRFKAELLDY